MTLDCDQRWVLKCQKTGKKLRRIVKILKVNPENKDPITTAKFTSSLRD